MVRGLTKYGYYDGQPIDFEYKEIPIDQSIEQMEENTYEIIEEEIEKSTVFKDEAKLSAEYLPETLLYQKENLKTLARHFRNLFIAGLGEDGTRTKIISGPVGVGKTSIANVFGNWVRNKGLKDGIKIIYVHINCRRNRTPWMISLAITRKLSSHVPTRGYSMDELLELIIQILEVKQSKMLLVLDEIDYAIDKGADDLLYSLMRASDGNQDSKYSIALILISRNTNYLSKLNPQIRDELSGAILELPQYTKPQIIEIIKDRIKLSFIENSVSNDSVQLTADIVSTNGDARKALEIMWYAGKYADKEGSTIVFPENVRFAKASIDPSHLIEAINDMSMHKLLLLLSISRRLKYTNSAYATTEEVEENYRIVCEGYSKKPRKPSQVLG